jgi:hypothetical protein
MITIKQKYNNAKRCGNGRPAGSYYHSEETKLKMKISHIKRYQQLEEIV